MLSDVISVKLQDEVWGYAGLSTEKFLGHYSPDFDLDRVPFEHEWIF
jgi:hypothetical protein